MLNTVAKACPRIYFLLPWHLFMWLQKAALFVSVFIYSAWWQGKNSCLCLVHKILLNKSVIKLIWMYSIQIWGSACSTNIHKVHYDTSQMHLGKCATKMYKEIFWNTNGRHRSAKYLAEPVVTAKQSESSREGFSCIASRTRLRRRDLAVWRPLMC